LDDRLSPQPAPQFGQTPMAIPDVVQPQQPPQAPPAVAKPAPQMPSLDSLKRLFEESRSLTLQARLMAQKHRRYYDGKIDEKLRRELKRKKQPDFTINRVRPGVEGMVGVVEKGKSDPRAYPRNPQDENSSEVATDTLRYICDVNRWQQNKLKVFRNILIEGTAAVLIEVDDQLEVKLRRVRFEEFFWDPYSREPDFSDASYMGIAKWQYVDEIAASYPEFERQLRASCMRGNTGDATWNDRPNNGSTMWADPTRKRMLIVEMYRRQSGAWLKCVFVGDLMLECVVSPYQDNDGKPCNPIEAHSAFIDDDNNRYGQVADMIGPQDEINIYRRKAAHRATFRQVQESDTISAYADPEEVRREAAKPDGVLPSGYTIVPDGGFQMDMALLQEAKGEIERMGPNPALLARGDASSGRQDLIRQQAGLTELAHLFSGLDDLELRVYRQAWARVRQWWTAPKFIRVTDDEKAVKFIQINEPVFGDPQPVLDHATGQVMMQPQFMGMRNAVAEMGVDIIVDSTPDTANVQQEQYQALVELAKVGALGPNPGPFLLQASSLPKKRELMDQLEKTQPEPPQPSPEQQQAMALDLAAKQAHVERTQAQTAKDHAQAQEILSRAGGQPEQPPSPIEHVNAMMGIQAQQATIDKTFAQADEARARAAKAAAEAHSSVFNPTPVFAAS
jgi:hypothetical protein